jgi:SAM-dependent methyltransferase
MSSTPSYFDSFSFQRYGDGHFKLIKRFLPKKNNIRVLDLGAARGQLSRRFEEIAKKTNKTFSYTGLELSKEQVKQAKKEEIRVLHANLNKKFPLKEKFDFIIASEIIEHVYDTDLFLQEVHRVLEDGGVFIMTTPNIAALGARIKFLFGIRPAAIDIAVQDTSGHIHGFTVADLKWLCERNNFRLSYYTGIDFWLPWMSVRTPVLGAFCLLLAQTFPTLSANLFCVCKKRRERNSQ